MWYIIIAILVYPLLYVLSKKKRLGLYIYYNVVWNSLNSQQQRDARMALNKGSYWDGEPFAATILMIVASICWPLLPGIYLIKLLMTLFDKIIKEK